jgi:NADH:ubiquinone oxidoreductase subunit E/ferredoxin
MNDIKVIIDGITVTGKKGTTILEAARSADIDIPTICHIKGLRPIGGCRVCVVEVEGSNRLVGSCHTPIDEGMIIKTRSSKVLRARKTIIDLMIASHTGPCVSDERIGQCELNRLASELEAGTPGFNISKARRYPVEDTSPYITRDLSRCILCGRCVKVCDEIVGHNIFSKGYRGFYTKIIVDCDTILAKEECKDCGICAEYCPTNALTIPDIVVQKKKSKDESAQLLPSPEPMRHDKLLSMLKGAQRDFGYVPENFIKEAAAALCMTVSEVYGVASFYAFLFRKPRGKNTIRICGSIPCYLKGSDMIVECLQKEIGIVPGQTTADGEFSLELVNCIGACDIAPAMLINDDIHGKLNSEKIALVLKSYKEKEGSEV